ncbi:MAG: sulfatase [Mariniblastus sp.]|nr:sulfatase [Mariniblastus sp.]
MGFRLLVSFLFALLAALAGNRLATAQDTEFGVDANILIVTVDDMSCDSVGAFGCQLPGTTPNIDKLASQGLRYHHAHVQTGSCYPSRNVLFSGRYSHNTGVEGFYQVKDANYPHLVDLMKGAGYFVGIRGKVSHSTPYQPYAWDADLTLIDGEKQHIKDPQSYYRSTKRGIEMAKQAGKPFCLNVNISDPHKPFYGINNKGKKIDDPHVPTRVYQPDEVPIPGFLFDHPDIRTELAHYYSSVRRADDCVAQIMKGLEESGEAENTIVFFLSDHGMPLPFAKTAVWHHSTRTPWIVRWPGITEPDSVDRDHMISAVDLVPTLLEIIGADVPNGLDGRSFLPTLRGKKQKGRDVVYKFHNENSGRNRSPMRSVESKKYGYIFNPWSDGKRTFQTATRGTMAFRAMNQVAPDNPAVAARLKLFEHGVPEEFYDYENDPDALHNLVDDPAYAEPLARHRQAMERIMRESNDPLLPVFQNRNDPAFVSTFVDKLQAEANERRAKERVNKPGNQRNNKQQNNPKRKNLFQLELPKQAQAGQPFPILIRHKLGNALGSQKFHVTLKDAEGQRIERIVQSAEGRGELKVTFQIPPNYPLDTVRVSAFVGEDYPTNLQHLTEGPVPVTQ